MPKKGTKPHWRTPKLRLDLQRLPETAHRPRCCSCERQLGTLQLVLNYFGQFEATVCHQSFWSQVKVQYLGYHATCDAWVSVNTCRLYVQIGALCPSLSYHSQPQTRKAAANENKSKPRRESWELRAHQYKLILYHRNKLRYTMVHQRDDAIMPLIPYNAKIPAWSAYHRATSLVCRISFECLYWEAS